MHQGSQIMKFLSVWLKRLVKLISILVIQEAYSEIDAKEKRKIEYEALRGSKFGKISS